MKSPSKSDKLLPFWIQLAVYAALSVALSAWLPFHEGILGIKDAGLRNIGAIYAMTVAFLMSISISRRRSLEEMVLLELNKVRRMNHLAKNIAAQQPELQKWYEEMHKHLQDYLEHFRSNDLDSYSGGNLLFRHVTYHVYSLPERKIAYNGELYGQLLSTTGSATEAREYVGNLIKPSLSRFHLGAVMVICYSLVIMSTAASPDELVARIGAAVANFCTFMVLEMFYEYEFIAARLKRRMADQYITNLKQLTETLPEHEDHQ